MEIIRYYNSNIGQQKVKPVMYVTEKGHPGLVCSVEGIAFIVTVNKTLINIESLIGEDHQ